MATMKAVRIHDFGGPKVLKLDHVPVPEPGDDEVLIKIHAASVNPVDAKTRSGEFPIWKRQDLPRTLGRDVSGVAERCGKSVVYIKPGDEVYALLDRERGGYAEYVAVNGGLCAIRPPEISQLEAAALPLAGLTAFQGLFDHGQLRPNQRVLIHGGAGGVGHLAIQLAKAKGARVATTVGADDMQFVSELGADEAIDYKSQRFEDALKDVDLVFDLIGGEVQDRSLAVIKRGGALVSTLGKPDDKRAHEREVRVAGYMTQPSAPQLAELARLVETSQLRPHIAGKFRLEQAAAAHEQLEREHTRGKIVLEVVG
jgi:NADPH:quinone reductase-like Zn-dependent oxidoreductase